jgi:hypothetical protein
MNSTQKKIAEMLCEGTGQVLTDSGGAYGRAYDRNRKRDFMSEDVVKLEWNSYGDSNVEMYPTKSLFWHLSESAITYDSKIQSRFLRTVSDDTDKTWFEEVENFLDKLGAKVDIYNPLDSCSAGRDSVRQNYTYNDENILDQDFVHWAFTIDADGPVPYGLEDGCTYVIIMAHNGCDARWGFTAPVIFECGHYDEYYNVLSYQSDRVSLYADAPSTGKYSPENLELFKLEPLEDWRYYDGYTEGGPEVDIGHPEDWVYSDDEADKGKRGVLYVDGDGVGYLPVYGTPISAWA